jgi:Tfp pilus assembly protein PilO
MKITKRDTILLAVLGVVAVLGGFWWFVVKPAKADLKAQKDELAQVTSEANDLRDTVSRLEVSSKGTAARTAERLRLSKAVPDGTETPGMVIQLQRLADRANVELTSIKTNSFSDFGSLRGTEYEVRVTGKFFDVDDFLYRLHRQVTVDEKDRPVIGGRLFATTSVDLTLLQSDTTGSDGGTIKDDDQVVATLKVMAFSSAPAGSAAAASADPAAAAGAPASPAPSTPTQQAAAAAATTTPTAPTPPSSGGTQ